MSAPLPNATELGFPAAFLAQMRSQLGAEYDAFLEAMCSGGAASRALRVNPLREGALAAAAEFIESPVPWEPCGYYARPETRPGASLAHFSGAFYMQEASAMSSAAVLNAQPGERILDLCAAPGGKSTQIAGALNGQGLLVSNEPEPARARVLAGNLERLGVSNAVVTNAYPGQLSPLLPDFFDAILVDAPCSGEGMFARDEAARAEWTPGAPEGCAKRQAEILDEAAKMLRPGGRLVYSTCTFNEIENEGSVRGFLARHADFSSEDFVLPGTDLASLDGMLHLYPHRLRGDGHFIALLRKADGPRRATAAPDKSAKPPLELLENLRAEVLRDLPDALADARLTLFGDRLYALPASLPPLRGIKLVQPGLCLLRAARGRVEPEHALAMALPKSAVLRVAELDEAQARAYCEGQALPFSGPRGWTLVCHADLPLGWGKVSDDQLKNHLPKGLRRRFQA